MGNELWSSDGTVEGTYLVQDICAGPGSSNPSFITCLRGLFYFQADDCVHGPELWVSDGQINGTTQMVRDIRIGSAGSRPSFLSVFTSHLDQRDYLIFLATDGLYTNSQQSSEGFGGSQIWRSDGTSEGTYRAISTTENDLYPDIAMMTIAFPNSMFSFDGALYIPGKRDIRVNGAAPSVSTSAVPSNGMTSPSIEQAAVVSDVDTPPSDFLTLSMASNEGVLIVITKNESTAKSHFNFLLAEALQPLQTSSIMNALYNMGNFIDIFSTGDAVVNAILGNSTEKKLYDCILLSGSLPSITLDVIATTRVLRNNGVTIPIIVFFTDSSLSRPALDAGANAFIIEPYIGNNRINAFQAFAKKILSFLQQPPPTLQLYVTVPYHGVLNISAQQSIVYGRNLTINGTAAALNEVLKTLSYYAPRGFYGRDSIVIKVEDFPHPEICQRRHSASPLFANFSNTPGPQLCDSTTHNVVFGSLPVLIVATNNAPTINLTATMFNSTIGVMTVIPVASVGDVDLDRGTQLLTDAFGRIQQPVYSVVVSAEYGTLSLQVLEGISLSAGRGYMDSFAALNGPVTSINRALKSMLYLCRPTDFCSNTGFDSIKIIVDDNGFTGKGGPKKSFADIAVEIV